MSALRAAGVHWSSRLMACLFLGCSSAGTASAADEGWAQIAATGRIVVGAHDAAWPVSYRGPDGSHVGYHMDICERIVSQLREQLNLPQLRMTTVPVTLATQTALLANDSVDLNCGPSTIRDSSLRYALFAHATLAYEQAVMTTIDKPRYSLTDLENKHIGLVSGGVAAPMLRAASRKHSFKVTEVFGRNVQDVFTMLVDGRVDAIMGPAPLLMSKRAQSSDFERFVLLDLRLGRVYAGITVGLGEEKLHALTNDVISKLAQSGELTRLYDKWHGNSLAPGFTRPICVPPSPAQSAILAEPGSEMREM